MSCTPVFYLRTSWFTHLSDSLFPSWLHVEIYKYAGHTWDIFLALLRLFLLWPYWITWLGSWRRSGSLCDVTPADPSCPVPRYIWWIIWLIYLENSANIMQNLICWYLWEFTPWVTKDTIMRFTVVPHHDRELVHNLEVGSILADFFFSSIMGPFM